jgi:hypothetical protein
MAMLYGSRFKDLGMEFDAEARHSALAPKAQAHLLICGSSKDIARSGDNILLTDDARASVLRKMLRCDTIDLDEAAITQY